MAGLSRKTCHFIGCHSALRMQSYTFIFNPQKKKEKMNKRDYIGCICWFVAGLLLSCFALLPMVLRELYQWKRYHLPRIEWEDIYRYGWVIVFASLIRSLII